MASAVGIDLGTTNTVVATVRDGVAQTLCDPQGQRLIPSVVSFHPSGSVLVGPAALDRRLIDAANTIYSVKRLIGRPWNSDEVQRARTNLPFELQEGPKGGTLVVARADTFSLPEISAFVLRHAKAIAEAALGEPVDRAVITVPANFNDLQRAATKTAGRLAGLDVLRILNEPTAAALAYGPQGMSKQRVAVYDLGGGTFDVTLLDLVGNVFEVLATAGDTALGGDDIDVLIAERMVDDLLKKHRFDARDVPSGFARLRILGEQIKCELSVRGEHEIVVEDLIPGDRGSTIVWRYRMTRPELEWASLATIERTFKVCQQALDAAGAQPSEIDRVVLVGGATRMPMVGRKVEQFFGQTPVVRINPDEVVALGAAIQAQLLDRSRQRAAGPAALPRIASESVVGSAPSEGPPPADVPDLPVVQAERPAPSQALRVAPPKPANLPTAPAFAAPPPAPAVAPPSPKSPARAEASAPAEPTEFLSGAARPLIFELEMPEPRPPAPAPVEPEAARPRKPPPPKAAAKRSSQTQDQQSSPRLQAPAEESPEPPIRPQRTILFGPAEAAPASIEAAPAPIVAAPAPIVAAPAPIVAAPAPIVAREPPQRAPLLIDVTPLSLCVETVGGFCDVLIEANTSVPCDRTRSFTTASDGQTSVSVRVAQGPSKRFADNTFLGELELSGIAPAARGMAQIAVTFEIDADGILNVRARDHRTGQETAARIQLVGAQTDPADIQEMRARQAAHPLAGLDAQH
jgi:molecular chaperone DnaK